MKIPARCNKRTCQARRNLSKRPEHYIKHPECHVPGCGGLMYIDEYRLRKGDKDNAPVCNDPTCSYSYNSNDKTDVRMLHRVSTKGCSGYHDHIANRNTSPRSKNSPIPEHEWTPF